MITIKSLSDPIIECDFRNVYAPSDDSYLILDYFRRNINKYHFDGIKLSEIKNILDLGTGTGIIALFFQILKTQNLNFNAKIYASDILEDAINCAKYNEKINEFNNEITFLQSDLFQSFPEDLKHAFNIIVFNPPYLPSSRLIKNKINKKKIDYSWDGGLKGFEIMVDFLEEAKSFINLDKKQYIYCISSSRTDLNELDNKIKKLGYKNKVVDKQHVLFENIILNRLIVRKH